MRERIKRISAAVVAMLAVLLFAAGCTPSKEACRLKYENAGYVNVQISAHTLGLSSEAVEYVFRAERSAEGESDGEGGEISAAVEQVTVVCFTDDAAALEYSDTLNADYAEEIEAGAYAVRLEGKIVVCGTPTAVELF